MTDATGQAIVSYEYDAFGGLKSVMGTLANEFRFAGEQWDGNAGLYYLRARYYDPSTGRFVSRDPFGGRIQDPQTLHKYVYGKNNPINMLDPSGLDCEGQNKAAEPFEFWTVDIGVDASILLIAGGVGFTTILQGPGIFGPKETYVHRGGGLGPRGVAGYVTVGKQQSPGGVNVSGLTVVWPPPFVLGVGVAASATVDMKVVTDPRTWQFTGLQVGIGYGTVGASAQYHWADRLLQW